MLDPAALDGLPLLAGASPAARRILAAAGALRRYAPGEMLFSAGSASRGLFVVVEGRVRVMRVAESRQHVVHTEGPGGTLGEVPLFEGGSYPATAVAAEPTVCLVLDRAAVLAAVEADPALGLAFLRRMARRVRELVERLDRATAQSVPGRLARFLLTRREQVGRDAFTLGLSQAELAEEVGTVREVVVRALRLLRDHGAIRPLGRGRYEVADVQRLREIAGA